MPVICDQNDVGLAHRDDPTIVGWMHGDEPDNAQSLAPGKGYGPPIPPAKIVADYEQLRAARPDPAGAAEPRPGRGLGRLARPRRSHAATRRTTRSTCKAATSSRSTSTPSSTTGPEVSGNLWYVARGVERLRQWTEGRQAGLELHRVHPDPQPDRQAHARTRSAPRSGCR